MVKELLVPWIIKHCDGESYKGMRWYNRDLGIFLVVLGSTKAVKVAEETPRNLPAIMNTAQHGPDTKISKLQKNTSSRGRIIEKVEEKSQIKNESSVNYGASPSNSTEDFTPDKKRPPILSAKVLGQIERRKTKKSSLKEKCNPPQSNLPTINEISISYEGDSDRSPLPPFNTLVNEHKSYESLRSNSAGKFSYVELMDYPFPKSTDDLLTSTISNYAEYKRHLHQQHRTREPGWIGIHGREVYESLLRKEIIHNQPYRRPSIPPVLQQHQGVPYQSLQQSYPTFGVKCSKKFVIEIYSVDTEPTSKKKNAPRHRYWLPTLGEFKETDQSND
ncbi:hypothetical protein CEXT_673151 [Caerostris extrusa]|uniref:Uncharacterized protein n=1 Tax=Caerostris extrusa TaxID=172846 RepID=A0AAV4UJH7_CAEEX|nr:hypothetical protein CEXT_673151 [Caerostris extrusa]